MESNTTKTTVQIIVTLLTAIGIVVAVAGYYYHKSINNMHIEEGTEQEEVGQITDEDRNQILNNTIQAFDDERISQVEIDNYIKQIKSENDDLSLDLDEPNQIDRDQIIKEATSDPLLY
jgi:hypothetical protein